RSHPLSGSRARRLGWCLAERYGCEQHRSGRMLNEQIAKGIGPARIDIAYQRRGNPSDPAVLLIMGLGAQLVHWPKRLLDELVSRKLCIIRFANRAAGHSTHMHDAPIPDLPAALAGDFS